MIIRSTKRIGLGSQASDDYNAFASTVSAGDQYLADGEWANAVGAYQAGGQSAATTLGPEIDTETGGASQPLTQQAWQLNTTLQAVPNMTAVQSDAVNAQSLAQQMQKLYAQALTSGNPVPAAPQQTPRDTALDVAAGALLQRLQTGGCTQNSFPECSAFQAAWNAAGGQAPLTVDGEYGTLTAASLQAALNVGPNQPPQAAPASCFGASTTPLPPTSTPVTVVASQPSSKNWTPWIIGGAVVAGGGILYGLHRYKKKHGHLPGMHR